MYEIELKAYVNDYMLTKKTIDAFANFIGTSYKQDAYWECTLPNKTAPMTLRIREQKKESADGTVACETVITYKRKELRHTHNAHGDNSPACEVNEEHELCISDRKAFEQILRDMSFLPTFTKSKKALQWTHDDILLELCTLQDLGDFLELEIIADNNNPETTKNAVQKLQAMLTSCGIALSHIEPKYYRELYTAMQPKIDKTSENNL